MIRDITADPDYPEVVAELGKARTALGVPLLREREVIGNIVLGRRRAEANPPDAIINARAAPSWPEG